MVFFIVRIISTSHAPFVCSEMLARFEYPVYLLIATNLDDGSKSRKPLVRITGYGYPKDWHIEVNNKTVSICILHPGHGRSLQLHTLHQSYCQEKAFSWNPPTLLTRKIRKTWEESRSALNKKIMSKFTDFNKVTGHVHSSSPV